jgi:hypothetical protein
VLKKNQIVEVVPVTTRICEICNVEKPLDEKNFTRKSQYAYIYKCLRCELEELNKLRTDNEKKQV